MTQRQETIPSGGDSITALILLLLPLLIISVALIFVLIAPFIIYLVLRFRPGVALSERDGPINVQYEEQLEFSSSFQRACQNWADQLDDNTRAGYELAQRWCANHPPLSPRDTDITMPQFLGIQEKGVSAWSFDPAYESNQGVMVRFISRICVYRSQREKMGTRSHDWHPCTPTCLWTRQRQCLD